MGALLGLMLGAGLLLIWRSGPRAPRRDRARVGWGRRHAALLHQAGVDGVGVGQLAAAQVGCALFAAAGVLLLTRSLAVATCFAAFGLLLPVMLLRRMRRRRQAALRDVWPEAIDNLASAVRAGMSLPEGLSGLAVRGPAELRTAFTRFAASYRVSGRLGECLDALEADLADPVGDRVCETVRMAHEVGGTTLARCCVLFRSCCARTPARARSWRPARGGSVNAARLAVAAPVGGAVCSWGRIRPRCASTTRVRGCCCS